METWRVPVYQIQGTAGLEDMERKVWVLVGIARTDMKDGDGAGLRPAPARWILASPLAWTARLDLEGLLPYAGGARRVSHHGTDALG